MHNSILHFIENDIKEIENLVAAILKGEKDPHDLSQDIYNRMLELGGRLIAELYEKIDEEIRESLIRKKKWNIEQRNEPKELLDILGPIRFRRTGYKDKETGKFVYLLDKILGIDGHQRITLGAAACILEEAVETSYAKGGRAIGLMGQVSKQTVKRLVHETEALLPLEPPAEKKRLEYLHIVADEDHVAAQFWNQKGDLMKDSRGNKVNTIMPKLICLYEDVADEAGETSKSPRHKLIGKYYFCGTYKGREANRKLWKRVRDYIDRHYDTEYLKCVYIAGDGAGWIRAGCEVLGKGRFVLDKFHMMKYVNISVSHLLDSAEEVKGEIWECLNGRHKKRLQRIYAEILKVTEEGRKYHEVEGALGYFLNQWDGIRIRTEEAGANWKCCAEGQVSHVLSARMSSRPMGWSEQGCDRMTGLRAYTRNGGKIIDLLVYQKERRKEDKLSAEEKEVKQEVYKKQAGWRYQERLQGQLPGLEQHSLKWMRAWINRELGA